VLLGKQWAAAVPLLQIFAVCGLTSALQSNLVLVIVARGMPKANTMMSAGMLVVYLPLLVYSAMHYGVFGAAWVHLVMSVIVLIPLHIVFFRLIELRGASYLGTLWRPFAGASGMAAAVLSARAGLDAYLIHFPPLMALIVYVLVGAAAYVGVVLALWHVAGKPAGAEANILATVTGRLRRLKAAPSV